jgi:hypothetical protein
MEFSAEFSSVILEGTSKVVEDPTEASRALDLLMRKYAPHLEPGRDYRGISASDLSKTSVFRVDIERWTGKGKTSDAPDAYDYSTSKSCPWSVRRPSSLKEFRNALAGSFHSAFWGVLRSRSLRSD